MQQWVVVLLHVDMIFTLLCGVPPDLEYSAALLSAAWRHPTAYCGHGWSHGFMSPAEAYRDVLREKNIQTMSARAVHGFLGTDLGQYPQCSIVWVPRYTTGILGKFIMHFDTCYLLVLKLWDFGRKVLLPWWPNCAAAVVRGMKTVSAGFLALKVEGGAPDPGKLPQGNPLISWFSWGYLIHMLGFFWRP